MRIPGIRKSFLGESNRFMRWNVLDRVCMMGMRYCWSFLFCCLLFSCKGKDICDREGKACLVHVEDSLIMPGRVWEVLKDVKRIEDKMRHRGLVEVREVDSTIRVELKYATTANFTGKILYRSLRQAYLLPEVAEALGRAQQELKSRKPGYGLLVYDAARPMTVQQEMWKLVKGTPEQIYVSNPARGGGLHNYGAAVDLTVVDTSGILLDMGCEFDYFGAKARVDREQELVSHGELSTFQLENRLLLREVMLKAGFKVLPGEWWHFNWISRAEAIERLEVIE